MLDFSLHCQVEFGAYAQTRDLTENNMPTCKTRAIIMGPSHNYQGGSVLFYSQFTGKPLYISKNDFTIVPMPEDAIQQISFMAKESPMDLSRDRVGFGLGLGLGCRKLLGNTTCYDKQAFIRSSTSSYYCLHIVGH